MKMLIGFSTLLFLSGVCPNLAAEESISGAVRRVDAEKGTIVVAASKGEAKTYDVLKKAKITVGGKEAALKDIGAGQTVTMTYNAQLEVVTAIAATGKASPVPELIELAEFPDVLPRSVCSLTGDGKTLIYTGFKVKGESARSVWITTRKSPEALFAAPKPLFIGNEPTISSDGLELMMIDQGDVKVARRDSVADVFARPKVVAEFKDLNVINPTLAGKDLVLYFERFVKGPPGATHFYRVTRTDRANAWSKPERVKIDGAEGQTVRGMSISEDGNKLFASWFERNDGKDGTNLVVLSLAKDGKSFEQPRLVDIGKKPVVGLFPRYVAATGELFFNTVAVPGSFPALCVIRNFDPDLHVREIKK